MIRHSARHNTCREAEQLIEFLFLIQQRQGWTASQMRAFIEHYITLTGSVRKQNDDAAVTEEYERKTPLNYDWLRQASAVQLRWSFMLTINQLAFLLFLSTSKLIPYVLLTKRSY
ncbi:hypothetical protein [Gimesia sp.]|uniref:hypothetical protein n=1 Tax=Gimesia sp. TaxID=2024833 RepID=UPI0032ED748E